MVHTVIYSLDESQTDSGLVLFEFQGSFTTKEENVQQLKIGNVDIDNNKAILSLGHHRLEGKKVKLPKPLAVIRKRGDQSGLKDNMDVDNDEDTTTEPTSTYDTVAILREKFVFTQRPLLQVQPGLRGLTRIGG
ncbi:predicted protein [Lichtheimia corymbifera JMRC:FSU:9682]|uniref:Chromosome transmission fidelity protein 8 n=1 Tax=Lichtheimia corymbifera JMRC:FSU:9682 TaxID=1263082 RepID=A0A068S5J0_9FUNG|nr:predicted protein [Lichtheimia corymbifera JMRC:FSU:9682]